jgi:hypothetical protein
MATTYAQITFGFPFWAPPWVTDWNKLRAHLIRPLRRCLGLPHSAFGLSVLAEFGIPDIGHIHEMHTLLSGRRAMRLPHTHPKYELFMTESAAAHPTRAPVDPASPVAPVALRSRYLALKAAWKLPAKPTTRSLMLTATNRSFAHWQAQDQGKLLRVLKTTAAPAAYLSISSRSTASLRARLRFDRSALNESRARRGMPGLDTACPSCHLPESAEHVLLFCPLFADARSACQSALRPLHRPFTMPSLLACDSVLKHRSQLRFLSATDKFFTAIHAIRPL